MGSVYRAVDKKLNEEVALKLIKPEIASDKKTIERFSHELKLARKISHRNVGRMYELMEDEGTHFITMEYVPGEDLKSFIGRSKQLAVGTAVSIAKQVCEGLREAHRLGVVHRDLKPSNIIIDMDKAIAIDPEFAMGYRSNAASYITLGDSFKAKESALKAFKLSDRLSDRERWVIQPKGSKRGGGRAYIGMKSIDGAQRAADELKELSEKNRMYKKVKRFYNHLMGLIELERENVPGAINYFKKVLSLMPSQYYLLEALIRHEHALFMDSLALAYYKSGDLEKAREEYEKITSLTIGRLYWGDVYAKSFERTPVFQRWRMPGRG